MEINSVPQNLPRPDQGRDHAVIPDISIGERYSIPQQSAMLEYEQPMGITLRIYPDPVLKQKCAAVTDFDAALSKLLDDMTHTMYTNAGIGLAAPQVGILKRLLVLDVSEERNEPHHFINPKIVSASGSITYEEGCLSIPDYRDTVKRNREIIVQASDRGGNEFELKAEGLLAVCIQHEIDHLDGILFIDRLSRLKRELFKRWYKKRQAA